MASEARGQEVRKRMTLLKVLGEILPVLGTIALLGLWLYQQVGVERRAGELRALQSARGVFQTYQSHNAVFNAINVSLTGQTQLSENLRRFQIYNYELGLRAIEDVLSADEKKGIPAPPDAYSSTEDFAAKMEVTQTRLENLQTRLDAREKRVHEAANAAKNTYVWLYCTLSLLSITGAVCKIISVRY